ncbi:MAG: hypothetical protein ACW97Z_16985 [Candidatus Hodarchaeales archaeon]|jgi:hypothetical protein
MHERTNIDSDEEDPIFSDQKCWTCNKTIGSDSESLIFCSETCERDYSQPEFKPDNVFQILRKPKITREYRISEDHNRDFMRVISVRKSSSVVLKIQDQTGLQLGEIRGKDPFPSQYRHPSTWLSDLVIFGSSNEFIARVKKSGEIETTSETLITRFNKELLERPKRASLRSTLMYYIPTKVEVGDLDDNPRLSVVWEDWEESKNNSRAKYEKLEWWSYRLESIDSVPRFLSFAISVCLMEIFMGYISRRMSRFEISRDNFGRHIP